MTEPGPCPNCNEPMHPGAVLCVRCGYDRRTGAVVKPRVQAPPPGRGPADWLLDGYGYLFQGLGILLAVAAVVSLAVVVFTRPDWTVGSLLVSGVLQGVVCLGFYLVGATYRNRERKALAGLFVLAFLSYVAPLVAIIGSHPGAAQEAVARTVLLAVLGVLFVPPILLGVWRWREFQ